jgi:MFS transporter, DHA2 family, multidrug resistance protein
MAAIILVFLLPLVGKLAGHVQARYILAFGWSTLAVAMYLSCKRIDLLMSFGSAAWMRIWQYIPVGFLFVPLTMAAYVGLPAEKSNAAAGLINFVRNIGQGFGTSAVTTLLARRSQYHQSVLAEYTRSHRFQAVIQGTALKLSHAGLSLHEAQRQALGRLYGMVQQQAAALSYIDVYWLLSVIAVAMFLLSFLLRKNQPGASGEVSVH